MTSDTIEKLLRFPSDHLMVELLGAGDANLRRVEHHFPAVRMVARGSQLSLTGPPDEVNASASVWEELAQLIQQGEPVDNDPIDRVVTMVLDKIPDPAGVLTEGMNVGRGRTVRAKTPAQQHYIQAIRFNTLTFGIGPAGTGKTYLAMAAAVESLIAGSVRRIVLTRPAVEAGERLGYLPGDLTAKIDPYLRPLYDALWDTLGPEETTRLTEQDTIEIAPLAYMRGRTLNDACIVLDEAQNTSPEQMKMFLTRLGFNSKMIITGDLTQTDLPSQRPSGLAVVRRILSGIPGVAFVEMTSADVVRHRVVAAIVEAYARFEHQR